MWIRWIRIRLHNTASEKESFSPGEPSSPPKRAQDFAEHKISSLFLQPQLGLSVSGTGLQTQTRIWIHCSKN
jgi:hypothetical protein